VDGAGSAYVTGYTASPDFPPSAVPATYGGSEDAFATKLTPAGTRWSTPPTGWKRRGLGEGSRWTGRARPTSLGAPIDQLSHPVALPGKPGYDDAFVTKLQLPAPCNNAVLDRQRGSDIAPSSFVKHYMGSSFTSWTGLERTTLRRSSATSLGRRAKCYRREELLSLSSPTQLNVVTPFDTATGSVPWKFIGPQGMATSTATMAQVAPAFFGYTLAGKFYPWR